MLTVLYEARPEPGRCIDYRGYITSLRRAIGGGSEPVEHAEYRSVTREGWLLSFSVWDGALARAADGRDVGARASNAVRREGVDAVMLDYRLRAGEVDRDTSFLEGREGPAHAADVDGDDAVVTVLSGTESLLQSGSDSARRRAESLGLDAEAAGLLAWEVFEAVSDHSETAVVLSWRSRRDAQAFEQEHELPQGARLLRINVTSDHRAARRSDGVSRDLGTLEPSQRHTDRDAQERLTLLAESGAVLGTTLDLVPTAQALADLLVSHLADAATVDVLNRVVTGDTESGAGRALRRVASAIGPRPDASFGGRHGDGLRCPPLPSADTPMTGTARTFSPLDERFSRIFGYDVRNSQYVSDLGIYSAAVVPLGSVSGFGLLTIYRWRQPHRPFAGGEVGLVRELASRAATAMENACAFTSVRNTAVALRRATSPRSVPRTPALQIRHGYDQADLGGRWYDVIRLPSARTALVVGEATDFGASAAVVATRLRTAVRALAGVEVPPQELLTRLNDLAVDLDADLEAAPDGEGSRRSTCLYLVYDPAQASITYASAGHRLPVTAIPGADAQALHGAQGPGLGQPQQKYAESQLDAEPGTLLALVGLASPSTSPTTLQSALSRPDQDLDAHFEAAARSLDQSRPASAPLVLARTGQLGAEQTAMWTLARDIAIVGTARALVERQIDAWGLAEDVKFVTVLIVSELVTNAVRHASAPIGLRLIRQDTLTCEVSDGSTAAPHLQHALPADEGGRGLLIVAETVSRWGVRHEPMGKTIWTEQELVDH
ncbi:ATP-binding SpoIIE family protein phosphatase [Streptomyces sp. NBC_01497]|uniref:ATP-binding SpoIIE family protein phosphatase n=1 Tax=Streptomyces sp. NBC_01497 TaxID=2903885 RepID=UPI002E31776F|nr:SpoIIE family protein phosphatase [Streptomyces sp. NBC_01497]